MKQSAKAALAEAMAKTAGAVSASATAASRAVAEASRAEAAARYAATLLADLSVLLGTSELRADCKLCSEPNAAHPACGHGLTLTTGLETEVAARFRPRETFTSPVARRRRGPS